VTGVKQTDKQKSEHRSRLGDELSSEMKYVDAFVSAGNECNKVNGF